MLKIYIIDMLKRVKKFSKSLLFSLITKTINMLIDLRERIEKSPIITLADILKKEGFVECPWCNGQGLLTSKGEPIE